MIKIYSWNVNGIRAVQKKDLWLPFLEKENPDILCLQEIKANHQQVLEIPLGGYTNVAWNPASRAGYSGTAQLSKLAMKQIIPGFSESVLAKYSLEDKYGDVDKEGRVLTAEYDQFWLVTAYIPNAKNDLSRIPLRHDNWDPALLAFAKELEQTKPVVLCGDFNVAHAEDDLANPRANKGKKGRTVEEIAGFQGFIDAGFIDTLRLFKQGNGHYSWWSYFANSRARNVGWRIDYVLVSQGLKDKVIAASIHADVMGSDHCPVSITLDF